MDNLIGLFEPSKVADLQNWQRAGRRIVFYGAGNIGGLLHDAMVATRQLDVACFCDGDAAKQGTLCRGLPVIPPERLAADCAGDVVVLATMRLADAAAMRERLTALGFAGRIVAFSELIKSDVDANRGICACIHEHHMERFFRDAETPERLAVFWADGHTGGGYLPVLRDVQAA